jgi:hypothetical protein
MSGPYLDLYVLCPARTEPAARSFLDAWAPARTLSAELDLPVVELIRRLEADPTQSCLVYWRSGRTDQVEHVMLAFTGDGGMIAGLGVTGIDQPRTSVAALLEDLATSVHATLGYVTVEAPPPTTQGELAAECEQRELAWIDGVIDRSRR